MAVDDRFQTLLTELAGARQQLRERQEADLKPGDGSGTSGGMDAWQTSVETRLGQLHDDLRRLDDRIDSNFRWLLGAYGGGVVLILGALAGGFLYLADKIGH